MVHGDGGDRRGHRPFDHVGGVEPAAQAGFQHQHIRRAAAEQQQGGGGGDLEDGDGRAGIGGLRLLQRRRQRGIADQAAGEADAFVEAHQMRRGIDMRPPPRGFRDGAQKGAGAALAIGAGDMDDRRQAAFRVAERREAMLQPAEAEVDQLRVQGMQAFDHRLGTGHGALRPVPGRANPRAAAAMARPPVPGWWRGRPAARAAGR